MSSSPQPGTGRVGNLPTIPARVGNLPTLPHVAQNLSGNDLGGGRDAEPVHAQTAGHHLGLVIHFTVIDRPLHSPLPESFREVAPSAPDGSGLSRAQHI